MSTYAYWRVSTNEQNEARQLAVFEAYSERIDRIFGDKQSGKDLSRPAYQELLSILQPNDLVIIKSIDRLSRKYDDVAEAWRYITKEKGADIAVLDMPLLDTRNNKDLMGTLISDIVIKLMSYVAETERNNIRQRQAEGIAAMPTVNGKKVSSKTGRGFGRPAADDSEFPKYRAKTKRGEMTVSEACAEMGISRSTWYALARKTA